MPPGLRPTEAPASHPDAARSYAVIQDGQTIGTVVLVLNQRPTGATLRRDWWAIPPSTDTRPLPRPLDTRRAAVATIRYRHATLHQPEPPEPVDATLRTVQAAYAHAGPNAAVWLAASITVHHLVELDANRQANPPALWHELHRVIAWLQAATGDHPGALSAASVHYRRFSGITDSGSPGTAAGSAGVAVRRRSSAGIVRPDADGGAATSAELGPM